MISKQEKFVNSQLTQDLYKQTFFVSMANPLVGLAIAWLFIDVLDTNLVYKWLAVLIAFSAFRLLGYILFKRKVKEDADLSVARKIHIGVSVLLGSTYAVAFASIILIGPQSLWALVVAIVITLSACSSIAAVSSYKTTLGFNIPLVGVSIVAFVLASSTNSQAYMMAAILVVFLLLFASATYSQNRKLRNLYQETFAQANTINEQNNKLHSYQELIIKDKTIGIYNRNFFDYVLDAEVHRAKRAGNNLSLVMVRIDAFEDYIEHYGQEQSTKCMRRIAALLQTLVHRGGETVSMFDKSTFGLVLPNVETGQVAQFCKKISRKFAEAKIPHEATTVSRQKCITLSMATAQFCHQHPIDTKALVDSAVSTVNHIELEGGNNIEEVAIKSDVLELTTRANSA